MTILLTVFYTAEPPNVVKFQIMLEVATIMHTVSTTSSRSVSTILTASTAVIRNEIRNEGLLSSGTLPNFGLRKISRLTTIHVDRR